MQQFGAKDKNRPILVMRGELAEALAGLKVSPSRPNPVLFLFLCKPLCFRRFSRFLSALLRSIKKPGESTNTNADWPYLAAGSSR